MAVEADKYHVRLFSGFCDLIGDPLHVLLVGNALDPVLLVQNEHSGVSKGKDPRLQRGKISVADLKFHFCIDLRYLHQLLGHLIMGRIHMVSGGGT